MAANYSRCIFQMFENQRWKWRPSSLNWNLRKTKMKILNMIWILRSSLDLYYGLGKRPYAWMGILDHTIISEPGEWNLLAGGDENRHWAHRARLTPKPENVLSDSLIVAVNAFRCSLLSEDLKSLTQPLHWETCLSITTLVNMFLEDFIHGGSGS